MGYKLLLPFDIDDPEFIRGFECGRVWASLREGTTTKFTVHAKNVEMMLRIAEVMELQVQSTDLDEDWIQVKFY